MTLSSRLEAPILIPLEVQSVPPRSCPLTRRRNGGTPPSGRGLRASRYLRSGDCSTHGRRHPLLHGDATSLLPPEPGSAGVSIRGSEVTRPLILLLRARLGGCSDGETQGLCCGILDMAFSQGRKDHREQGGLLRTPSFGPRGIRHQTGSVAVDWGAALEDSTFPRCWVCEDGVELEGS